MIQASRDPTARAGFQQLLLGSDLYVATADVSGPIQAGESVRIFNVAGPNGGSIPAVFTAEQRLAEAFGPGTRFMRMPAADLLEMIAADGAFLNPGLAYGVYWTADELGALLGRPVRRTLQKDTEVMLGSPAQRPEALIARLEGILADVPDIEQAWLALAVWPETESQTWFLDVRARIDADAVAAILADVLKEAPFDGRMIDLVVNRDGAPTGIRIKPPL